MLALVRMKQTTRAPENSKGRGPMSQVESKEEQRAVIRCGELADVWR